MSSIAPQTFYVYLLCYPDGTPFYVGKGRGRRMYDHDAESRRGHHCHKCHTINKIWREGGEVQRIIVFTTTDEQEAFAKEKQMISFYGRSNLTNQSDGGEGQSGYILSAEHREKIRTKMVGNQYARGNVMSDEAREKIRAGHLGKKRPADFGTKASERMKGARLSDETKAKISERMKGRTYTEEQRAAKSEAMLRSYARRRERENDS